MTHRESLSHRDPLDLLRADEERTPPAGVEARVAARLMAAGVPLGVGVSLAAPEFPHTTHPTDPGFQAGGGMPAQTVRPGTFRVLAQRFLGWSVLPLAAGVILGASARAHLEPPQGRPVVPSSMAPSEPRSVPEKLPEVEPSSAPAAQPAPSVSAVRSSLEETFAQERAILDRARQKLSLEPARALAGLEQHAQRFPNGRLAEEREAMWVQALVSLQRAEQARKRGAAFRARFPKSLMLPSVEAALQANSAARTQAP